MGDVHICSGAWRAAPVWLAALVLTLLNAVKPLHMDDVYFWEFARHIARRPLDPYGFAFIYYGWPEVANHAMSPPVLPYWWAGAIRLAGDNPVAWKLSLLPFALLLVFALDSLYRRFAPGLERPLTWMTVLSPPFLPGFNLMQDIPALALSLTALGRFLEAADRGSIPRACLAGALAALAIETKYSGCLAPAAMLMYAAVFRRWRLWVVAAGVTAILFVAWETFTALRYGEAHFIYQLGQQANVEPKSTLIGPVPVFLGGLAPALGLLTLIALGASAALLLAAGFLVIVVFGVVCMAPDAALSGLGITANPTPVALSWNQLAFGALGILVMAVVGAAAGRLCWSANGERDRAALFLVLWLALELAGYFAMSPFAAARRFLGMTLVGTLLAGRLAARRPDLARVRRLVWSVSIFGICLGLGYYGVDLQEALADKQSAEQAADWIRERDPDARIWFSGYWGFQYYAERAGMRQIVPFTGEGPAIYRYPNGRQVAPLAPTLLRKGDWVVMPHPEVLAMPKPALGVGRVDIVETLRLADGLPLRTLRCYYAGVTPLEQRHGPRVVVRVGRVRSDFMPAPPGAS